MNKKQIRFKSVLNERVESQGYEQIKQSKRTRTLNNSINVSRVLLPYRKTIQTYLPHINIIKQLNKGIQKKHRQLISRKIKQQSNNISVIKTYSKQKIIYQITKQKFLQILQLTQNNPIYFKTQTNIQMITQYLKQTSLLFNKIPQLIITSLFQISKVIYYPIHSKIYLNNEPSNCFYLILYGKVALINKEQLFKRICRVGDCFGQQILFQDKLSLAQTIKLQNGVFPRLQNARVIKSCHVLKIQQKNYKQFQQAAYKHGHKQDFMIFHNYLVREFHEKCSLRQSQFY